MLLNVFVGLFVPPQVMLLVNRALMPLKTNSFLECALKIALTISIFSPKCTKYRLAAGLCSDPLGELTVLAQFP